jgi:hypothetical protein
MVMTFLKHRMIIFMSFFLILISGALSGEEICEDRHDVPLLKIPHYRVESAIPFAGEKLYYEIRWRSFKAAEAQVETSYAAESDEKEYHLVARAQTTGFARKLWRMDDWAEAFTCTSAFRPREYRLHVREIFADFNMSVFFSPDQTQAHSVRISSDRMRKDRLFQCHHAYDPGSASFLIRSLEWEPGQTRWFEIVEGNDRHLLIVEAIGDETLTVVAGTFDTVKIVPALINLPKEADREDAKLMEKIQKMEKETHLADEVYVWVARDGKRPIVKTWAKAFIGYLELELVSME